MVEEVTRVLLCASTIPGSDQIEVSANLRLSGIEEVQKILYSVSENDQVSGTVQYPIVQRKAFQFTAKTSEEKTLLVHPLTPVSKEGSRMYFLIRCRKVE